MAYTAYRRRGQRPQPRPIPAAQIVEDGIPFLCQALHDFPCEALLSQIDYRKQGAYAVRWQNRLRREQRATRGQLIAVHVAPHGLLAQALPASLDNGIAPYGLAYDLWIRQQPERWFPISRYYGLVVATLPAHDAQRAARYIENGLLADSLLCLDRAISNLATIGVITPRIESLYRKFVGARNLFIDRYGSAEGSHAARTAYRLGAECYAHLKESING